MLSPWAVSGLRATVGCPYSSLTSQFHCETAHEIHPKVTRNQQSEISRYWFLSQAKLPPESWVWKQSPEVRGPAWGGHRHCPDSWHVSVDLAWGLLNCVAHPFSLREPTGLESFWKSKTTGFEEGSPGLRSSHPQGSILPWEGAQDGAGTPPPPWPKQRTKRKGKCRFDLKSLGQGRQATESIYTITKGEKKGWIYKTHTSHIQPATRQKRRGQGESKQWLWCRKTSPNDSCSQSCCQGTRGLGQSVNV